MFTPKRQELKSNMCYLWFTSSLMIYCSWLFSLLAPRHSRFIQDHREDFIRTILLVCACPHHTELELGSFILCSLKGANFIVQCFGSSCQRLWLVDELLLWMHGANVKPSHSLSGYSMWPIVRWGSEKRSTCAATEIWVKALCRYVVND